MADNAKLETTETELIEAIRVELIVWAQGYDFLTLAELDSHSLAQNVLRRLCSRLPKTAS